MDLLTIAGIVLAIVAITGGQYLEGGQLEALINGPAMLIVIGGTVGAVLLQTPRPIFNHAFRIVIWVIRQPKLSLDKTLQEILSWSYQVRKSGLLALEDVAQSQKDKFARKGLTALVDGIDSVSLRQILEVELNGREEYELQAARVFESMGGYSPTIGILGAVIGLIQVMRNLYEPS